VAGFGIAIDVGQHEKSHRATAVQRLGKIETQARDFSPALREIRKSFYAGERKIFNSGGPDWRPDTPRTLARKAKRGEDPASCAARAPCIGRWRSVRVRVLSTRCPRMR
jgi:hypothetical protein